MVRSGGVQHGKIASRLAHVRRELGFTQERVAQLLGVDRPKLSEIEQGKQEVDTTILGELARLYGVSTAYLLGIEQAARTQQAAPEMRFRAVLAEDRDVDALELSGFLTFIQRFTRLADKYDYAPPVPDLPHFRYASNTRNYAVEGDASRLRNAWGLGDALVGSHIFTLLEDHGIGVYRRPVPGSEISGAYYDFDEDRIGNLIFINASEIPTRQVFTAAHELAHLVYHHGVGVSKVKDTTSEEKLCNRFAAAFLMPNSAIEAHLAKREARHEALEASDVINLQRTFGVSYFAMLKRLRDLGILRGAQYSQLASERPVAKALELGYIVRDWEFGYAPENFPPEVRAKWLPRGFIKLVYRAVEDGYLSEAKAADYMNLSHQEWLEVSQPPSEEPEETAGEQDRYELAY